MKESANGSATWNPPIGLRASGRPTINPAAFRYYDRLSRVDEYVERHLSGSITRGTVARVAGLEEKYFSTFFRTKTGATFSDWLTDKRVRRAAQLLSEGDYSITAVCRAVGYGNLRSFERAFRRIYDMTPRAYKRSVQPTGIS